MRNPFRFTSSPELAQAVQKYLEEIYEPQIFESYRISYMKKHHIQDEEPVSEDLGMPAREYYGDISKWDVSQIQDFSYLFSFPDDVMTEAALEDTYRGITENFDLDITSWNMSQATNLEGMFQGCEKFNQNIGKWNTFQVKNLKHTFSKCARFNQKLLWDVSQVENMLGTFDNCFEYNQPLSDWNVSQVKNMRGMFMGCFKFNQNLSDWKMDTVQDVSWMFYKCQRLYQNFDTWDLSRIPKKQNIFLESPKI